MLTHRMVPRYVTAALLARRYAFEGFDFTRARRRLPIVARELGKEEMTRILQDTTDPTATTANASRHIEYVDGAFN
jgi:ferritin-like metal-binding protein YciE